MLIRITLKGTGGELDSQLIETNDDDSAEVSEAIHDVLAAWVLAPGDTISVTESVS